MKTNFISQNHKDMIELTKTDGLSKAVSMTDNFWNTDSLASAKEPKYAVNIKDSLGKYKLEISAPGFKKKDFNITIENGVLHLIAESSKSDKDEQENYLRKEFSHASFTGSFSLPENVLEDHISAKYNNGLFTIDLKKSAKGILLKKRQIKVK